MSRVTLLASQLLAGHAFADDAAPRYIKTPGIAELSFFEPIEPFNRLQKFLRPCVWRLPLTYFTA